MARQEKTSSTKRGILAVITSTASVGPRYTNIRFGKLETMDHAKKMVLIPQDALENLKRDTQPKQRNHFLDLDREMDEILQSKLEPSEKWKRYEQILQRYLFFTKDLRKDISLTISNQSPITDTSEEKVDDTTDDSLMATIAKSVPPARRNKANLFTNHLRNSRRLRWDANGKIFIDGQELPGSSLIDLVNDAVRTRKNFNPTGSDQLIDIFREVNMPREYIANLKILDHMRRKENDITKLQQQPQKQSQPNKSNASVSFMEVDASPSRFDRNISPASSTSSLDLKKRKAELLTPRRTPRILKKTRKTSNKGIWKSLKLSKKPQ